MSGWTTTDELLAALIEVTDRNGIWFFQANVKKGTKVPPRIHVPRPWDKKKSERGGKSTADEVKAFMRKRKRARRG